MKSLLGALILCLAFVGTGYAQGDPFDGTWKLNVAKSDSRRSLPAVELLIFEISGRFGEPGHAETGTNDITDAEGTRRRSQYTATYNDGKWHQGRSLDTGQPSRGRTMMIRMDPRSELRLGQRADGTFSSMILRVVQEDGKTMRVTTYSAADHQVGSNLLFEKTPHKRTSSDRVLSRP
jgi:hypothetical protein